MRFIKYLTENEMFEVPSITGKSKLKTNIHPKDRSLKNLPRDGKKKAKCKFQDWLGIKGNPGKGTDDKWYGYSHRAIYGFGVGDEITPDTIGNKYAYMKGNRNKHKQMVNKLGYDAADKWLRSVCKSYTIKSDKEAKEQAERFRDSVS